MKKNSIEEIDRLGKLLEKGLITEEEFKSLKNKTLKSSSDKGSPLRMVILNTTFLILLCLSYYFIY